MPDQVIEAYLFDDHVVSIDRSSLWLGGAWNDDRGRNWRHGRPTAWDPYSLKFFYNKVAALQGPLILDIGANTGSFALLPAIVPCRVVALEPNPEVYELLVSNVNLNGIAMQVEILAVAASDRAGFAELSVPGGPRQSGLATLEPHTFNSWRVHRVETVTIDGLELEPDLIKIDVSEHEPAVLRGALKTIERHKPGILITSYKYNEIHPVLAPLGYTETHHIGVDNMWWEPR